MFLKNVQIYSEVIIKFNLELLSPDINHRIKVRDIFFHPWVTGFEKEYKDQILSQENNNNDADKANEIIKLNSSIEIKENMSKDFYKSTEENSKSYLEISKDKINIFKNTQNENVEIKEKNSEKFSMDTKEYSDNANFFDSVLCKVQGKNKKKKKKLKSEIKEEVNLDFINVNKSKANKNEKMEFYDKDNYSILDEISIIESKISEIEKSNKFYESTKNILNCKLSSEENSPVSKPQIKKNQKPSSFKEIINRKVDSHNLNYEYYTEINEIDNNLKDINRFNTQKQDSKINNIILNTPNKPYFDNKSEINDDDFYLMGEVPKEDLLFNKIKQNVSNRKNSFEKKTFENNEKNDRKKISFDIKTKINFDDNSRFEENENE